MIIIAQVIETNFAYKLSKNIVIPDRGNFPLGTIRLRGLGQRGPASEFFARPAWNMQYMPLLGEHVVCFKGSSDYMAGSDLETAWFYIGPVNSHGSINLNPIPDIYLVQTVGDRPVSNQNYNDTAAPVNRTLSQYVPGQNFKENSDVKTLQPYEGDILLHGRFGQSIRLSSTQAGNLSQYDVAPFWEGKGGSPITIISNGRKPEPGPTRYVIEDPNTTKSFLLLSNDQRIKFNTSQPSIGLGIQPPGTYTKAQAIISSERLLFNSSVDEVILCGKKTVNVVTPAWQMDMDKLFTILEKTLQQLADLASGKASFSTTMGGPTLTSTNVAQIQKLLVELKTMKQ